MDVNFETANRIIFGEGSLSSLRTIGFTYGKNVLIIKGLSKPNPDGLLRICKELDLNFSTFEVANEPHIGLIDRAVDLGRSLDCEFVIGFGGGSVIDTGKAVAALLNNKGSLLDYLEVVGKGQPLEQPSLPYIAIPTTAGTGSEVTKNAVISVPEKNVKVSMRNSYLLPTIAIVDPELTYDVPPTITVSTGMDAFTQVIEPYVSNSHNALVDMFCREAIPTGAQNLEKVWHNGEDINAREKMAWVSLLGGLALANGKLGAVHGFAGPIGGMFSVPHGMICAALLASVIKVNTEVLSNGNDGFEYIERYSDIAKWITGNENATLTDGIEWLDNLAKELEIPKLSALGISKSDFPAIIQKSMNSSSMKGNPVQLTMEEMQMILELAF